MKTKEFLKEDDHEASMARAELMQIAKNAIALAKIVHEGDDLPGWVSSYITLANDHLNSVHEHMEYNCNKEPTIAENATSGATSSGAVATSMGGGGAGFGKSIFMKRTPTKAKKK
jgi:hypothetical protein